MRGGHGQPRHVRARGPARARARQRPAFRATLEKLSDLPIVGDVRGDGYFYGIELVKDKATRETFNDDESERLLRGFLSSALFDAGLYCRADDRGDPVIQLAPPLICGQAAVRRDRADPARGADRGLDPALTRRGAGLNQARPGKARHLQACPANARHARPVPPTPGTPGLSRQRQARQACPANARHGQACPGKARPGLPRPRRG